MNIEYGGSAPLRTVKPYVMTVSAAGLVHVSPYSESIYVNGKSLIGAVKDALNSAPVVPDAACVDRDFAARIYVVVEFLGDMKQREESEPDGADALEEAR